MIKYEVKLTPEAEQDIDDIFVYIAEVLESPLSARHITEDIYQRIFSLAIFPEGYARVDQPEFIEKSIRRVTSHKYIIFYVVDNKTKAVSVLRVLYSRREITVGMMG